MAPTAAAWRGDIAMGADRAVPSQRGRASTPAHHSTVPVAMAAHATRSRPDACQATAAATPAVTAATTLAVAPDADPPPSWNATNAVATATSNPGTRSRGHTERAPSMHRATTWSSRWGSMNAKGSVGNGSRTDGRSDAAAGGRSTRCRIGGLIA